MRQEALSLKVQILFTTDILATVNKYLKILCKSHSSDAKTPPINIMSWYLKWKIGVFDGDKEKCDMP